VRRVLDDEQLLADGVDVELPVVDRGLEPLRLHVARPPDRGGRRGALPERPSLAQQPRHVLLHLLDLGVQALQPLLLLHGLALHRRVLLGQALGRLLRRALRRLRRGRRHRGLPARAALAPSAPLDPQNSKGF